MKKFQGYQELTLAKLTKKLTSQSGVMMGALVCVSDD